MWPDRSSFPSLCGQCWQLSDWWTLSLWVLSLTDLLLSSPAQWGWGVPIPLCPALTSPLTPMACFDNGPHAEHGCRAGQGVAGLMFSLEDIHFAVISVIKVRPFRHNYTGSGSEYNDFSNLICVWYKKNWACKLSKNQTVKEMNNAPQNIVIRSWVWWCGEVGGSKEWLKWHRTTF